MLIGPVEGIKLSDNVIGAALTATGTGLIIDQ